MHYNNNYKAYEIDRRGFTALFRDEALPTAGEREETMEIIKASFTPLMMPTLL